MRRGKAPKAVDTLGPILVVCNSCLDRAFERGGEDEDEDEEEEIRI